MSHWKSVEDQFRCLSKAITFSDAVVLLNHYGYIQDNKGKTSGSRVRFTCNGHCDILMHRPHPEKELKAYVVKDLRDIFIQEGFFNA